MKKTVQITKFSKRYLLPAKILVAVILMTVSLSAFAQQKVTVTGNVTSAEGSLPGVAIMEKGTQNGAVTDLEGNYKLSTSEDAILVFTFIGYQRTELPINGRSTIDLMMVEDIEQLEEIVVIGYGTQKKSHLTGAISKVTNEKLDQLPVSRVDDALIGQVSGVNIQATNAEAGGAPTITIRGVGSITADSGPAVVVDGVIVSADFLGNLKY